MIIDLRGSGKNMNRNISQMYDRFLFEDTDARNPAENVGSD